MNMRLITIPLSHYCEKARWALQRTGLEFEEIRRLQGLHALTVKKVGAGPTVPVLVVDENERGKNKTKVLGQSHDILEYCHDRCPQGGLYPDGHHQKREVLALERDFDEGLGVATRHVFYACVPSFKTDVLFRYNNQGVPRWQDRSMRWFFPVALSYMRKKIDLRSEMVAKSHEVIRDCFERITERLSDGRRYLVGDHFTAADLSFAALSAPMLGPNEYGVRLPGLSEIPAEYLEAIESYRAFPAGQFALRLYAKHRNEVIGSILSPEPPDLG